MDFTAEADIVITQTKTYSTTIMNRKREQVINDNLSQNRFIARGTAQIKVVTESSVAVQCSEAFEFTE
jgi:hypothetical protein